MAVTTLRTYKLLLSLWYLGQTLVYTMGKQIDYRHFGPDLVTLNPLYTTDPTPFLMVHYHEIFTCLSN